MNVISELGRLKSVRVMQPLTGLVAMWYGCDGKPLTMSSMCVVWTARRLNMCCGSMDQRLMEPSEWPRQMQFMWTQVRQVVLTAYSPWIPRVAMGESIHSRVSELAGDRYREGNFADHSALGPT